MNSLSYQERHNYILQNFIICCKSSGTNSKCHDIDVIKEHHRFLWNDNEAIESWEVHLARRYYNKLFKEYCIADLTHHKDNKVALRWRTKNEVVTGKGQFQCGSRKCEERENLRSWEVNFSYKEHGEHKNALVKIRLCSIHSEQLNYNSRKREVKRLKNSIDQHLQNKKSKLHDMNLKFPSDDEVPMMNSISNDMSNEPSIEKTCENEDNIWARKPDTDIEKTSRETEFERYLEDLLL